ncbi:hypothetical protein POM88_050449 [Heracleum sosnowskyi]|uniref:Uncharacterized protein n=1 Tax=Heracleum sosnowskyi TaxID=360622 RepID=A0AAD8H030_9APIA|nr:hypothetical protein POM88_050449 [Heracleum sosnowskyi]
MDSPCSSSGSSSSKLQNKLRRDKGKASYSDLHSEVKRDVIKTPRLQKEELVKYMSKLPRFLDKGEKVKAKPLNLGVLDWNTLENWQNYHPPRPSSRYSTSSSITASSLWTDGSSNYNGRGDGTFSPSGHKVRRPSLHSYLTISPIEGHSKHVQSHAQNVANYTDIKVITANRFDTKQSIPRDSAFPTKSSEQKLRKCKRQSSDSQKTRSSTDFQNYGLPSPKGKWKVKADASRPGSEKLQNQYGDSTHCGFSDGSREAKESISSDRSHLQEVYSTDLYPSTSNSCAITRETGGSEGPPKEQMFSFSLSRATKLVNRAKSKISEEKISIIPTVSSTAKPLKVLNLKSTNADSEAENPSPSCRLSSVLNSIRRRSYHSRYSSDVLQFSSEDVTAKSGSDIADSFVCSDTAKTDHSNSGSKDHFSPLKRWLNPLLKTKGANSRFSDHSPKNSISTCRFSASFDKERELSSVHRPKVKLDFTNLRTPNLDDTHRTKTKGSSTLQAHFQVSTKNDLPLFTFAVDNSDVLLATLRKFSSRKNDPTWIYTFFSVHEMRRKSGGWLSQGSKVKDYVPNVVAQMKVSDLPISNLDEPLSVDQLSIREFVLYAVGLQLFDHQTCDRQLNDELAAIVVKFPRKTITGVEDSFQKSRVSSNLRDLQEDKSITGNQELFRTTVVLPGGIHGLPSKGEASALIERWFSGGQCDCGGWDLGCKVNVFSNNNQKSDGHFELFSQSQEKAEQATPFFSLSPHKNGIFSVKFDSTLSLLQAFSICVAVFDSIKQSELQQPSKSFEQKLAEEARLPDICGVRTPKLVKVDVPSRFASQPPHTPAERV